MSVIDALTAFRRNYKQRIYPDNYGGLQMRVRDGCGTVQGAVATWRLRNGRSRRRQVATAPCTVPEIAPFSRKRNRKLI